MHDILSRARQRLLIGWCRRALARTATGVPCHPNDSHAAAWSLHGALMRATHELGQDDRTFHTAREAVRDVVWRDHRLYLMWCDDHPAFTASCALAAVEAAYVLHSSDV